MIYFFGARYKRFSRKYFPKVSYLFLTWMKPSVRLGQTSSKKNKIGQGHCIRLLRWWKKKHAHSNFRLNYQRHNVFRPILSHSSCISLKCLVNILTVTKILHTPLSYTQTKQITFIGINWTNLERCRTPWELPCCRCIAAVLVTSPVLFEDRRGTLWTPLPAATDLECRI